MILQISTPAPTLEARSALQPPWDETIRKEIFRKMKPSKKIDCGKGQKEKTVKTLYFQTFKSSNIPIVVRDESVSSQVHAMYSLYVPILEILKVNDQYRNTFPNISYLEENHHHSRLSNTYGEIASRLTSAAQKATNSSKGEDELNLVANKKKTVEAELQRCLQKFVCPLDTLTCIKLFLECLKYGTGVLETLYEEHHLKCSFGVFCDKILNSGKYLRQSSLVRHGHTISIQRQQDVDETSIGSSNKQTLCGICLRYDCGRHALGENKSAGLYVHPTNIKSKISKISDASKLYVHYLRMRSQQNKEDSQAHRQCSENCFKMLTKEAFKLLEGRCQGQVWSLMTRAVIQVGIEMFSFDPCLIHTLFPKQQSITCSLIFFYLVWDLNVARLVDTKMHVSEEAYLLQQQAHPRESNQKAKGKKIPRNKIDKSYLVRSDAVCLHHFIHNETQDIDCQQCSCIKRGFCVPQCLCGPNCPLRLQGCACKSTKANCRTNNCPCFKFKRQCDPNLCQSCFNCSDRSKTNSCSNEAILYRRKKKLKIGDSTIPGAGLGLFAMEIIEKDEYVISYYGQLINESVDLSRQSLSLATTFYNFGTFEGPLDARFLGNKARFINHGNQDEQNLRADTIVSEGALCTVFYSLRRISKGEQLFFNYDGGGQLYRSFKHKYPFIKPKKDK